MTTDWVCHCLSLYYAVRLKYVTADVASNPQLSSPAGQDSQVQLPRRSVQRHHHGRDDQRQRRCGVSSNQTGPLEVQDEVGGSHHVATPSLKQANPAGKFAVSLWHKCGIHSRKESLIKSKKCSSDSEWTSLLPSVMVVMSLDLIKTISARASWTLQVRPIRRWRTARSSTLPGAPSCWWGREREGNIFRRNISGDGRPGEGKLRCGHRGCEGGQGGGSRGRKENIEIFNIYRHTEIFILSSNKLLI